MAASEVPCRSTEMIRIYRIALDRRGYIPRSTEKRLVRLVTFARWMAPRALNEATRADVKAFLDKRRTRDGHKVASKTLYGWISNLHSFYAWALIEGLAVVDPTPDVVRPRIRNTLPRPIATGDLDFALRAASPQFRAMLSLAAFAGLRCQEIAGLDREDILESKGLILVRHGKGGKERLVPLHRDVLTALRSLPMPETGRLFERPMGGRHTPETMSIEINRYLRALNIDATAHQLRHWFATELYANTHDLRLTQDLLGHAHSQTTAGYVAWSRVDAAATISSLKIGT